jgi:NADH dehydrogenase [ubiquinone] 1 alpha subcomplex assembly factor 5
MAAELFDVELRAMRRDRAFRRGTELFLYERSFDDCLDRLAMIQRRFGSALLIGCPDPEWPARLGKFADNVAVIEPGTLFARAAGAAPVVEDSWAPTESPHDLCLAVGTLDTVNDLPRMLLAIRASLAADAFLIGAMAGGETLPRLRAAMRAADEVQGVAAPHVHPRIEAASLAGLLSAASFVNPVVDIDRVRVSYESLDRLVADLRSMGVTNVLKSRARQPLGKAALAAARQAFAGEDAGERIVETFEILHFAAWTPSAAKEG